MPDSKSFSFAGIPVVVNPYMAPGELWLVQEGKKSSVWVHEGPQAGETVEIWLQKPHVVRIVNLGDAMKIKLDFDSELRYSKVDL